MIKLEIDREVLHQLAKNAGGGRPDVLCESDRVKVREAARRLANATAIPENGPIELVVLN
jgi:hypothetical protein